MIAGGREITFRERQADIFEAGANSIVLGNYLTTAGREVHADLDMLQKMGFEIALTPDDK
jgi:biotin synthase